MSMSLQARFTLPSWVKFPSIEKAEWINTFLLEFWPNLEKTGWKYLQEKLEPMISEMIHDYHLHGFKFNRLELGKLPPRVEGVRVESIDRDRVILDIDLVYHGDLRLSLSLMKMSAGVSDIKFEGKLRCVLHLVDVLPLVGSVEMMFLQPPNLDFDLHGAANVLDMPGLHGMIREVVIDSVNKEMVYPHKLTILTAAPVSVFKMLSPKPQGVVRIVIEEAANLPQTDLGGLLKIDPYCVIQVTSNSIKVLNLNCCVLGWI